MRDFTFNTKIDELRETQKTLKSTVTFLGKGLHSGRIIELQVMPAGPDHGLIFQRIDLSPPVTIPACFSKIDDTQYCTRLRSGQSTISTTEHLLAALSSLGIDNALIQINGPEVPILDGSSKPFLDSILSVGIKRQNAAKKYLRLKKAYTLIVDDKWIHMEPCSSLIVDCEIDFESEAIGNQRFALEINQKTFQSEIGLARTFCRLGEVKALQAMGLAQGGSLENAVVVNGSEILNEDGLRDPLEFVKHKILDFVGDMALLGMPLLAKVSLKKSGHGLHAQLMQELAGDASRFEEYFEVCYSNGSRIPQNLFKTKKFTYAAAAMG